MLGKQVNVGLRHTPFPPYAVNTVYQHHIHFASENGLSNHFQARTVKGQAVALLGGSADNGISCLFRIAAKLGGLCFKRKAVIVGHTAVNENSHTVHHLIPQSLPGRSLMLRPFSFPKECPARGSSGDPVPQKHRYSYSGSSPADW